MSRGSRSTFSDEHRGKSAQAMPVSIAAAGECSGDVLYHFTVRPARISESLTQTISFHANGSSDFRNASRHRYRLNGSAKFSGSLSVSTRSMN